MSGETKSLKIALLVAGLMLCVAVFPLPYSYYTVLRVVVFGATAYVAYRLSNDPDHSKHFIPLVVIAVLFNPFFPVHLTQLIWLMLDLSGAVYFLLLSKKL